jgi:hypothetical protein
MDGEQGQTSSEGSEKLQVGELGIAREEEQRNSIGGNR